ncbi:MAG: ABC transporter ATP-binding protein [Dehalococcoidia bacterium]
MFDQVRFSYGERVALDGLSLVVPRGSIFGLLGPNGSGKSTLISLLVGRRVAEGGDVRLLGSAPSAAMRARVGVVFQEPSLDAGMTVRETMQLQARLFGLRGDDAQRDVAELLERVGLDERASSFTSTLSGGMKRRLELARALVTRPDAILLDEPTLALDPDSKQALWEHLSEANGAGRTLLLATNDVYEAERYCDTVALLDHGRVVEQGTPAELKRDLRADAVRIEWRDDPAPVVAALDAQPGVGHVRLAGRTTHVTVDEASAFLTRIFQQWGDAITGVHIEPSTLEDVYFQLVGSAIVDERGAAS